MKYKHRLGTAQRQRQDSKTVLRDTGEITRVYNVQQIGLTAPDDLQANVIRGSEDHVTLRWDFGSWGTLFCRACRQLGIAKCLSCHAGRRVARMRTRNARKLVKTSWERRNEKGVLESVKECYILLLNAMLLPGLALRCWVSWRGRAWSVDVL